MYFFKKEEKNKNNKKIKKLGKCQYYLPDSADSTNASSVSTI